jgi:hypothetical protein
MSTTIIPNCFHSDGSPCVSYTLEASGGSYSYHAPPTQTGYVQHSTPSPHVSVPEPSGLMLLAVGVIAALARGHRKRA